MKNILTCVFALCPIVASADYLDDKIADLTKQKLEKIAQLEECQKNTKGLKIAGITTLGISAIGIGANIGEAVALDNYDKKIAEAKRKIGNLDTEISGYNTCGSSACNPTDKTGDFVCVNGGWFAKKCVEGFHGDELTCTRDGKTIKYVASCDPIATTPVDSTPCTHTDSNVTTAVYVNGVCTAFSCKSGTYLEMKGNVPQNKCLTTCPDYQVTAVVVNGQNLGDGCDVTKSNPQGGGQQGRKQHDLCTAEETAKIQNADVAWWNAAMNKCVAKSCKTGTFLKVKGNASQGECMTSCETHQIIDPWTNGGKACDIDATAPQGGDGVRVDGSDCTADEIAELANAATTEWRGDECIATSCVEGTWLSVKSDVSEGVCTTSCYSFQQGVTDDGIAICDSEIEFNPTDDCARKVFAKSEYGNSCAAKCRTYSFDNYCKLDGMAIVNKETGECICNPSDADKAPVVVEEALSPCPEFKAVASGEQSCKTACDTYATSNRCTISNASWSASGCVCNPVLPSRLNAPCPEFKIAAAVDGLCNSLCRAKATNEGCVFERFRYENPHCICNPVNVNIWDLTTQRAGSAAVVSGGATPSTNTVTNTSTGKSVWDYLGNAALNSMGAPGLGFGR